MSWQTLATSRIAGRFDVKGPFIFDLDRWYKEPYPNKVVNALDVDGKDSREKNEKISWAYAVIRRNNPSNWCGWRLSKKLVVPANGFNGRKHLL